MQKQWLKINASAKNQVKNEIVQRLRVLNIHNQYDRLVVDCDDLFAWWRESFEPWKVEVMAQAIHGLFVPNTKVIDTEAGDRQKSLWESAQLLLIMGPVTYSDKDREMKQSKTKSGPVTPRTGGCIASFLSKRRSDIRNKKSSAQHKFKVRMKLPKGIPKTLKTALPFLSKDCHLFDMGISLLWGETPLALLSPKQVKEVRHHFAGYKGSMGSFKLADEPIVKLSY